MSIQILYVLNDSMSEICKCVRTVLISKKNYQMIKVFFIGTRKIPQKNPQLVNNAKLKKKNDGMVNIFMGIPELVICIVSIY